MERRISESDNFGWLLGGLVFLLFTGAVFDPYQVGGVSRLVNISIMGALLAAIWSLEMHRGLVATRVAVTLGISILMLGDVFFVHRALTLVQLGVVLAFMMLTTWAAARQVLFTGAVDSNKIIGSICLYILMGLSWAFAYLLAEAIRPGSLNGLQHEDWHDNMLDVIYFSFVTLTTLGYGDMSPAAPATRFLAYMQALTGQFYIAILVASLVGIRLAEHQPEQKEG